MPPLFLVFSIIAVRAFSLKFDGVRFEIRSSNSVSSSVSSLKEPKRRNSAKIRTFVAHSPVEPNKVVKFEIRFLNQFDSGCSTSKLFMQTGRTKALN